MLRNIDFEALRALRDRHGAAFPRGRVIFRENDTSAEFYVILQGSVELSVKDPQTGGKHVLFVVQPGGFFGEMSCFSGAPRSATAAAAEDSVLLFFNQDTAIQLMRASPRFALGVIQTLCDRIRNNNDRISRLSALIADPDKVNATATAPPAPPTGAPAPAESASAAVAPPPARPAIGRGVSANLAGSVAAAASAARPTQLAAPSATVHDVPPPAYDKSQLWGKVVVCPVSSARFMALNVRPEAVTAKSRDSDFRDIVKGPNPLWYLVYACPECGYAGYPDDYATPTVDEVAALARGVPARQKLMEEIDLNGERDRDSAMLAFRLALDSYARRAANAQRTGGLYHRLAWLARESGDADAERGYLTEALKHYVASVDTGGAMDGPAELTLLYTIGDLYLRLGRPVDSVKWLSRASQHPEFRRQPDIARLLRERWTDARESARPKA